MLEWINIRIHQGAQAIPDVKKARPPLPFRGLPSVSEKKCSSDCLQCVDICPTGALKKNPLTLDLGRCNFCGACERICPSRAISFSNNPQLASTERKNLELCDGVDEKAYQARAMASHKVIRKLFGRSLKLRQVSAGGCNACELELNACSNVNFDMQRFGIEFVASPRHADGVVITGPVTENMAYALEDTFLAVPKPRILIVCGSCGISGGLFDQSPAVKRTFFEKYSPDLYLPGCPIHPLTFVNGVLDFLGR